MGGAVLLITAVLTVRHLNGTTPIPRDPPCREVFGLAKIAIPDAIPLFSPHKPG